MDDGDRDDTILEERLAGRSVLAIAKQYRCSTIEVEAVIDQRLNYALDNDMRLQAIKLDVARLEALMVPFFERATRDRDVAAGTLCCKLLERRALLLGLDHPTQSRVDVYQVEAQRQPSDHDRIRDAIMTLARGPNWRDLPPGKSADAVDVLSDEDASGCCSCDHSLT